MKPFYTLRFLVCCALFQLGTINSFYAQNTPTLNIQGVLRNSNGTSVDNGIYKLRFSLYTVETGGVAVWSETQDSVVLSGGVYSTALGIKTPLTAAFDQTYYLGVKVGSGQEMTPRALLSSAPYAFSLIGQSNIFPSVGTVGAGTNAPTAGYQFHAKKSTGDAKILVEGSTAASIDFKKDATTASLGFGSANNNFVLNPGANNTTLQYNGDTKLTVNADGVNVSGILNATNLNYTPANLAVTSKLAVGQNSVDANNTLKVNGTSFFNGFLEIDGNTKPYFLAASVLNFSGSGGTVGVASSLIRSSGSILAPEFWAFSDQRIKKDIQLSNSSADLATLNKLQVKDYRHIDVIAKGGDLKKGFIAQEVKSVFGEAVTVSADFIPNIYALSHGTQLTNGKLTISLEKTHELNIGDEVKLMLPEGGKKVVVLAIPTNQSFVIDWSAAAPKDQIFVYGKKVNDFNAVDYDRIFTLNVSATQELARQVEQLKKENQALKLENSSLKAADERFESRLKMLESKLNN